MHGIKLLGPIPVGHGEPVMHMDSGMCISLPGALLCYTHVIWLSIWIAHVLKLDLRYKSS